MDNYEFVEILVLLFDRLVFVEVSILVIMERTTRLVLD